jgi:hypothetical protein
MVELNQQQEQLVERLLKERVYGTTPGEVIHNVFRRYCVGHPELIKAPSARVWKSRRHG